MRDYRLLIAWSVGLGIGILFAPLGLYGGIAAGLLYALLGVALFGRVWIVGILGLSATVWLLYLLVSSFGVLGLFAGIAAFGLVALVVRAITGGRLPAKAK